MKIHIEYQVGDKVLYSIGSHEIVGTITYKAGHFIYAGFVIDGNTLRDWHQIKPYKKQIKLLDL